VCGSNSTIVVYYALSKRKERSVKELKRIREEAGITQTGLAEVSGVSRETINRVEKGKISPRVETLEKLADVLDAKVGDFFPKAQASPFRREEAPRQRRSDEFITRVYGDDFYGDKQPPGMEMDFVEYLFRLEDLMNEWYDTMRYFSHPERLAGEGVQQTQLAWSASRLEETCRHFVHYLEERRTDSEPASPGGDEVPAEREGVDTGGLSAREKSGGHGQHVPTE
jgi:transcriptional regulator with XRE-family HTH domain